MHSMCGWSLQQKNTTPKSKVCNIPQPTLQKSTSLAWMTWRCFNLQVTQPKQDSTGLIHKNDRWFGFSCHFKQAPDLGNNQSVGHVGLCQAGHVSSWRSSNTLTYLRVWKKKESGRLKKTNTLESVHGPKKSLDKLLPMSMQNGLCGRRKKQWSNNPTCFALCRGLVSINLRQVTSFSLSPIHLDTSKAIASNCKNHNFLALFPKSGLHVLEFSRRSADKSKTLHLKSLKKLSVIWFSLIFNTVFQFYI